VNQKLQLHRNNGIGGVSGNRTHDNLFIRGTSTCTFYIIVLLTFIKINN